MKSMILGLIVLIISNVSFADHSSMENDWSYIATIESKNLKQDLGKLFNMDIDIAGVDHKNQTIDVLISNHDYSRLTKLGLNLSLIEVKGVSRGPDQKFKNPTEIEEIIHDYANRFPEITKLVSIGKSLEGRDIWALKITDNPSVDENEPSVLFNSMHHAREIMTPEVSLDIIDYLLTNYRRDDAVTRWVDSIEIWVIPMFNVDGNNKMWTSDMWWRKNVRGGYGVDLNRNYPTGWNSCNGSSSWRSSQTYRGSSPASEPETQSMMKFVEEIRPVFDISYHSYSELVIYPFGCSPKRAQTREIVEGIGQEIARLIDYKAGTAWELLYNADGGDIDWMYESFNVIPYVIELNSSKTGFHPNYDEWRDKTVLRNRAGWQYLLDRIFGPGIYGKIDKAIQSSTIIKVFKKNKVSFDHYQDYNIHKDGSFFLILENGEYRLKYSSSQGELTRDYLVDSNPINVNLSFD